MAKVLIINIIFSSVQKRILGMVVWGFRGEEKQFIWRWKSKGLINKCLLGPAETMRHRVYTHHWSVVSNSLQLHGLWPARLLCPWNSSGKNTAVGCHFLRADLEFAPPQLAIFFAYLSGINSVLGTVPLFIYYLFIYWQLRGR